MMTENFPLPLVTTTDDEALESLFAETHGEPTPETPQGTAFLWWSALQDPIHYRNALDKIALRPVDWNDYSDAAEVLNSKSMMSVIEDNADDPCIKYAKFIDYSGSGSAKAFAEAKLQDSYILTVVQASPSAPWQVWGLSHNHFPTVEEVRAG